MNSAMTAVSGSTVLVCGQIEDVLEGEGMAFHSERHLAAPGGDMD